MLVWHNKKGGFFMNTVLLMRKFGITTRYQGYFFLPEAIDLAIKQYGNCMKITKDIYPVISRRYGISTKRIERNIRTVIEKAWENNQALMEEIAGEELTTSPSNGQFIDIVTYWLMEKGGDAYLEESIKDQ